MYKRFLSYLACVAGLWLLVIGAVHAHGVLTASVPADGDAVSQPESLEVRFNQPVRLLRLELSNEAGERVDFGFSPVPEARQAFAFELPSLSAGQYRVDWVAIGSDGHRVEEQFGFAVEMGGSD